MDYFSHGGQVNLFAKQLSCDVSEVIDLSSNINFLKPIINNIDFNKIDISVYPVYDKLYTSISNNYRVKKNEIELFNCEYSSVSTLFSFLNQEHCTIYSPSSLKYKKIATTYSYEYDIINKFTQINRAVKEKSLVIFENPSTVCGKYYNIESYLKAWNKLNCIILIDEKYLDFTNYNSVIKYINKYKNIYVLKSISKFYSSSGIRCGIIISNSNNIQKLKQTKSQLSISTYDSLYIQEILKDEVFKNTSKAININNFLLLKKILNESKHIKKVFQSDVNFLLLQLNNINAIQVQEQLKKYKILIKNCSSFDFLDDSYVRIAVNNEKTILLLKDALNSI